MSTILPKFLQNVSSDVVKMTERIVNNIYSMRSELWSRFFDRRRDIYDECGYPHDATYDTDKYKELFDREPVAARVVEVYPKESWQVTPRIFEDENPDTITAFEASLDEVSRLLNGEDNLLDSGQGSLIYEYLKRVDELSGIGRYGVLLLGLDDIREGNNKTLADPVDLAAKQGALATNAPTSKKLLFLRAFPESLARVTQLDTDPRSPRYGQPVNYLIDFSDPKDSMVLAGASLSSMNVHWTRVIHVCDTSHQASTNEVIAAPRMRPVLNRLLDLQKLYGGSAEMYWRGAFPGLSIETHPQLGGDVEIDRQSLKDMTEEYMNGLQRYLALQGMTAKSLAPQVVDPTPQINVQIEAICIKLGVPKRIFMGTERGELASSQDDAAWNDRLRERQNNYLTPRVIAPFINRLISLGVLARPAKAFKVIWPDLTSQADQEKAAIALSRTQALSQYVQSGLAPMVSPLDYLIRYQGFDEAEARAILENVRSGEYDDIIDRIAPKEQETNPNDPANGTGKDNEKGKTQDEDGNKTDFDKSEKKGDKDQGSSGESK